MVPGAWSDAELDYQARQVASMLAYNCGFNCNGSRLIVLAKGWALRARFEQLVKDKLAATPTRRAYYPTAKATWDRFTKVYPQHTDLGAVTDPSALPWTILEGVSAKEGEYALAEEPWCSIMSFVDLDANDAKSYLDAAVPFANDRCWGTLSINAPRRPARRGAAGRRLRQAVAALRYGAIAINCWSGLNYGLVNSTWGAFPGHPSHDIQSGQGVVHNGLLLDHPQKSIVRAPFIMKPTPAWFTDHKNNLALGRRMHPLRSRTALVERSRRSPSRRSRADVRPAERIPTLTLAPGPPPRHKRSRSGGFDVASYALLVADPVFHELLRGSRAPSPGRWRQWPGPGRGRRRQWRRWRRWRAAARRASTGNAR